MSSFPKMPRVMKRVYEQIESHPRYKELDSSTIFAYKAARDGLSWCTKENNKWVKQIWYKLYVDWNAEI